MKEKNIIILSKASLYLILTLFLGIMMSMEKPNEPLINIVAIVATTMFFVVLIAEVISDAWEASK